jgi:replicative DNA helicase
MESNNVLYDNATELYVIGTLLSRRDALYEVREYLAPDCFYKELHKQIYKAILNVTNAGDTADIITVLSELKKTGTKIEPSYIAKLGDYVILDDLKQQVLHLSELNKRRELADLGLYLQQNGSNECNDISDVIANATDKINGILGDSVNHIKCINDYLPELCKQINDNLNGKEPEFTHVGFEEIDKRCLFQPNNLIIAAGDSSQGKSSFANAVTLNAASTGSKIAIYSMEMTSKQLVTRLAAMISKIPCGILYNSKLSPDETSRFDTAVGKLSKLNIFFDDRSTSNIDTIISSIRSMKIKNHIDGIVIDYLQILSVNTKTGNVEAQLAEASRRLKNVAKELDIWILLFSQLSRNTDNPEPTLARLRGSGQVNEAADATILIYRPSYYTKTYGKVYRYSGEYSSVDTAGTALINIAKSRNTGIFSFICGFDEQTTSFYDMQDTPKLPFNEIKENEPF